MVVFAAVARRLKRNGAYAILVGRERLEVIARGEGWPGGSAVPVDPVRSPGGGGEKPGSGSSPGAGDSKPGGGGSQPGGKPGGGGKPGKSGR